MKRSRPNSFDVAEIAGVSQSTVSRALRGDPAITEKTRTRVTDAARSLGYVTDARAANLRTGRSGAVALVVLFDDEKGIGNLNPFYSELERHVVMAGNRAGLSVMTQFDSDAFDNSDTFERNLCDGFIVLGSARFRTCWDRYGALARKGVPVVAWGSRSDALASIATANVEAAQRACAHLVEIGCRNIACLSSVPKDYGQFADRIEGYRLAMDRAGLPHRTLLAPDMASRQAQGRKLATDVLAAGQLPDGIFATCDLVAIGCMNALQESGIAIPGQIAICGFDGIQATELTRPTLTTVEHDMAAIASRLVSNLVALTRGAPPDTGQIPARLRKADSTGHTPDSA
jgi:DNA-binding LacI/PurR family transcriptional regulator